MTQEKQPKQQTEDWSQPVEEQFSDVFWTSISPWSVAVTFGLRMARPGELDKPKLRMRMPLEQAKALAVMLLRGIRAYETEQDITVDLPVELLKHLGIPLEDWKRFTQ